MAHANGAVSQQGMQLDFEVWQKSYSQARRAGIAEAGDHRGAGKFGREFTVRVGGHSAGDRTGSRNETGLAFGEWPIALSTRATGRNVPCISYSSPDGLSPLPALPSGSSRPAANPDHILDPRTGWPISEFAPSLRRTVWPAQRGLSKHLLSCPLVCGPPWGAASKSSIGASRTVADPRSCGGTEFSRPMRFTTSNQQL